MTTEKTEKRNIKQSSYREAKAEWKGSYGQAIRCLLSLRNSAGSWLWFIYTIQHYGLSIEQNNAGDMVNHMLRFKLQDRT